MEFGGSVEEPISVSKKFKRILDSPNTLRRNDDDNDVVVIIVQSVSK